MERAKALIAFMKGKPGPLHGEVLQARNDISASKSVDGKPPYVPQVGEVYSLVAARRKEQGKNLPGLAAVSRENSGVYRVSFTWRPKRAKKREEAALAAEEAAKKALKE